MQSPAARLASLLEEAHAHYGTARGRHALEHAMMLLDDARRAPLPAYPRPMTLIQHNQEIRL